MDSPGPTNTYPLIPDDELRDLYQAVLRVEVAALASVRGRHAHEQTQALFSQLRQLDSAVQHVRKHAVARLLDIPAAARPAYVEDDREIAELAGVTIEHVTSLRARLRRLDQWLSTWPDGADARAVGGAGPGRG